MYPSTVPKLPRTAVAMAAAVLTAVTFILPLQSAAADDDPLAADTMSRTVAEGWGSAETGGSYTASPEKAGAVDNGTATLISPAPGQTASMSLDSVEALDVVSRIDVNLPDLPTEGSKVYVSNFVRGDTAFSYAVVMVVDAQGESELVLERKNDSVETKFATVPGPQLKAGEAVSLELSVVGTDVVELGAKAWVVGTDEPESWMAVGQDEDEDRLVSPGGNGVGVYASSLGEVTAVEFDNLLVDEAEAAVAESESSSPETASTEDEAESEPQQEPSDEAQPGTRAVQAEESESLTTDSATVSDSGAVTTMAATEATSSALAADKMARTVKSGWGSATTGGAYTAYPATAGAVANGVASLVSPGPGASSSMTLGAVKASDVESSIDVALPSLPASGSKVYISHFVRGQANSSYVVMLIVGADGKSELVLERKKGSVETKFKTVTGPQVKAGQAVTLKISAVGTTSVQLGAKAWTSSTTEPTKWMAQATDSASARISTAGPVGVALYASASGKVTPANFDNLSAAAAQSTTVVSTTPTPTPTATAPTSSTISTPNYAGRRMLSGSAQLNTLSYPIPSSAVYVATDGSDSNAGTKAKPFKTISAATKAAKANGTVVVRGGVYHESVLIYPRAGLTVQAYPKETVWLDGSEQVTGWTKSGSVWVKSNWATFFDSSPTYVKGAPDGTTADWRWVNSSYPMAAYPDQVWVNDSALKQVSSRSAVTTGTFYVDKSAKQLVIGSDPSSKRVDVSTLAEAMSIRSTNSVIRGIGVRRYATSVPMMGAITTYYSGITLENVMIVDNATTGLFIGATNATLKNVTLRNNGLLGMAATQADNLTIDSVLAEQNNSQRFNCSPVSGAMKITTTRKISVKKSAFVNNYGRGPWFDESSYDLTFADNDVVNNSCHGVMFELSDQAKIVNNLIANNGEKGMIIQDSGNVAIWNNTFVGNVGSLDVVQG